MSKAVDFISINNLIIAVHDNEDMEKLGSFLLALSRTDVRELGCRGNAEIKAYGGDYVAIFRDVDVQLRRPTPTGIRLFRVTRCPACNVQTHSITRLASLCNKHYNEFHNLDEKTA